MVVSPEGTVQKELFWHQDLVMEYADAMQVLQAQIFRSHLDGTFVRIPRSESQ